MRYGKTDSPEENDSPAVENGGVNIRHFLGENKGVLQDREPREFYIKILKETYGGNDLYSGSVPDGHADIVLDVKTGVEYLMCPGGMSVRYSRDGSISILDEVQVRKECEAIVREMSYGDVIAGDQFIFELENGDLVIEICDEGYFIK